MRCTIGLAAALLGVAMVANAADRKPEGDFVLSCRNIEVRGADLYAECDDGSHRNFVPTELKDWEQCNKNISNNHGRLYCDKTKPPRCGSDTSTPCGSYRQTCREITVSGKVLHAVCQRRDRSWVEASLESFDRCSDIGNDNGKLYCRKN